MDYIKKDATTLSVVEHQEIDFAQHEEIRKLNVVQGSKIDNLTLAMFGNPADKNDKGTKQKVDEMYEVLVGTGIVKKVLSWTFGVIVAIVSFAYLVFSFVKDVRDK